MSRAQRTYELTVGFTEDVFHILTALREARAQKDRDELRALRQQERMLQDQMMQWGIDVNHVYACARGQI